MPSNKKNYVSVDTKSPQAEIERLNLRIAGLEKTAETAAEMGDSEAYINYCREVTKLHLQREVLERKMKIDLADMPAMYGRRIDTLLQQ